MRKRVLILAALMCLVVLGVLAGSSTITLDKAQPMQPQIEEFVAWYESLDFLDQAQWDLAFSNLMAPGQGLASTTPEILQDSSKDVEGPVAYLLPNGSVYHLNPNCQYVRSKSNVITKPLSEVHGRKPCSKCAK